MSKKYENDEPEVLAAWYSDKAFVKVKQNLGIGKILFSFVDLNTKENIDCYMTAEEFGALLMTDVRTNILLRKLLEEKNKGEKYPKHVWSSPIGGTSSNGKTISRSFTIAPGSSAEIIITATAYDAEKSSTGAFIAKKNTKPLLTLRVPCTYDDLRILCYKWSFLEKDYMTEKYSVANTTSTYSLSKSTNKNNHEDTKNTSEKTTPELKENDNVHSNCTKEEDCGSNNDTPSIALPKSRFKTKTLLETAQSGFKYVKACRKDDKEPIVIIFLPEQISKIDENEWNLFAEKAVKNMNIPFDMKYCEKDGKFYFHSFE